MHEHVGEAVEIETVTGYDYDGVLDAIEGAGDAAVYVLSAVRKRGWVDGENLASGAHEFVLLKGQRRFRACYVVHAGPCSLPRT